MNKQLATPIDYTVNGECAENCGKCCSEMLILSDAEITKIKKYMKQHPEIKLTNHNNMRFTKEYHDVCPFLDDNKKCQIYEVRPEICSRFMCNKYNNPDYKPLNHKGKKVINMVETFMNETSFNAPDTKTTNKMYQDKKKEAGIK